MIPQKADTVVVGAGISGLVAAYNLKKKGVDAVVLEASDRVGGWVNSVKKDGLLLELGPNTVLLKEHVARLVSELGLKPLTTKIKKPARYIYLPPGKLVKVPSSPGEFLKSEILSPLGKLRILLEPITPRTKCEDLSVEKFITKYFGHEVAERIVAPVFIGIWGTSITNLSARATLGSLWDEPKSILFGKKPKGGKIISFDGGLSELCQALAKELDIYLTTKVESIDKGWKLKTSSGEVVCKNLFVATEHKTAARLLGNVDDKLAALLGGIPATSISMSHIQTEASIPDGFGFLCAPGITKNLLGCIFNSQIFEHVGSGLLTLFHKYESDVEEVAEEVEKVLGVRLEHEVLSSNHYRDAIPQYRPGHCELVEEIKMRVKLHEGLCLLTNATDGVSLPDRIRVAGAICDN